MIQTAAYAMIYLGSLLMVYNICGFIRFVRYIKDRGNWEGKIGILYLPVVLLIFFLFGYLGVGFAGDPELIVAGILFGGSIFVFVMYKLLSKITGRIIENERLEARLQAAEENNRIKNSFLASISHEMRTPMNVILGLNAVALKHPDLPAETREQLHAIGKSGRHMLGLINNILDMQQIENGELTARKESFSLPDTVEQVAVIARTQCERKGLTWRLEQEKGIPDGLTGDAMMLKQTLLSLLDNAVKFTDAPGTVSLAIRQTSLQDHVCTLEFTVSDTGIGMSPEFVKRAFELFAQEDGTFTSRYGGSGMGLTAAKSRTELMGGEISIKSQQHEGTTLTVRIPFQTEEQAHSGAEERQSSISLEGQRVLIVEDMDENAEIVADLLELEGAESERAENGQTALEMFAASSPHYYAAILMDLRMPVMDGLESARRIRAMEREDAESVPIIALTANAFEIDVQHSIEAGMNTHLVKPVDADLLYGTLREWIARTRGNEGESA